MEYERTEQTAHKRRLWPWVLGGAILIVLVAAFLMLDWLGLVPHRTYTGEDFNISTVFSGEDFNANGVDDYADLVLGARKDAENHPTYDGTYYQGGYPPDHIGVCTDVVWRAFRQAGYCLREMVDLDIRTRPQAYPKVSKPDINIDFRRVRNLEVFFQTYGQTLTLDPAAIDQWQPGDIVIFGENQHIGVVSDKRSRKGVPYVIHNGGQPRREEDILGRSQLPLTGHYRFDPDLLPEELLIVWSE